MHFKQGENLNVSKKENIETETNTEKTKIKSKLISLGERNYNPFIFRDSGLDENSDLIKNTKINKKVLEGLSPEDVDSVKYSLQVFKSYLEGPIFTDNFHRDHSSRRIWDKKYLREVDEKAQDYYKTNRLKANRFFSVIGFLSVLRDIIVNPDIKNKLAEYRQEIPTELIDKDKEDFFKYGTLDDDEKIRVVNKFSDIVKKLILLLEEN